MRVSVRTSLRTLLPLQFTVSFAKMHAHLSYSLHYLRALLNLFQVIAKLCEEPFEPLVNLLQIGHSAYVDSPLGPDAFREYETLLIQDHEELLKKCGKLNKDKDNIPYTERDFTSDGDTKWGSGVHYGPSESSPGKKDFSDDDFGQVETRGKRLSVTVCHFPMIFSPISSRTFVLPSEGTIAESYLSNHREDSLSPGLPSISTGKPFDGDEVPPGLTLTAQFLYHLANKVMIFIMCSMLHCSCSYLFFEHETFC